MATVNLSLRGLLEYIKYALEHGRYEAALGLVHDALAQTLPGDTPEHSGSDTHDSVKP